MNKVVFSLLFMLGFTFLSNGQVSQDTFRVQGYLIMRKTEPTKSSPKDKMIILDIDLPQFYFFKPIEIATSESMESLFSPLKKTNEIFLPMGLTENERDIKRMNFHFKFYTNIDISLINEVLEENESFENKTKSTIKLKKNYLSREYFEVVYIDGIWIKVSVPAKYRSVMTAGRYLVISQNKFEADDLFHFYILKEIKVISYNPKFYDEAIIQLK